MHPALELIPSDEAPPREVDVVVIGGGIVGAAATYAVAKAGQRVALVEKGYVGAEQSSRNWGWCRQQNRDARELPLAMRSMELWESLGGEIGRDLGFRRCGLVYATTDPAQVKQWESWRSVARSFGVDTRMLTGAEAARMSGTTARPWLAGIH
ncbi:MAG TPA: FAD-dependent oxidoreductase, partial [Hyphomicrobiaceae bacterium]|nr:FAD-dependent oxidoreductase [Hyphomicrobiaceae bacterium]